MESNNDLVLNSLSLAHSLSNKLAKKYLKLDKEDITQLCYLGLVKASKAFDASRGFEFSTCAYKFMLTEVRTFARDTRWIKGSSSVSAYETPLYLNNNIHGKESKYIDFLEYKDSEFDLVEIRCVLESVLSQREIDMVTKVYFEGMTRKEIAIQQNCTPQNISILLKRALAKVKNSLEKGIKKDSLQTA